MEIINPSHRYILFARQGKTGNLLLKLARDIRQSNGRVLLFTDLPFGDPMNVRLVRVETLRLGLGTLLDTSTSNCWPRCSIAGRIQTR